MATSSKTVEKGLALVSVDFFFDNSTENEEEAKAGAKADAEAVQSELGITFTDDRGPTQMGAAQGEHATAYSLYVEFAMRLVGRYISAAQSNNHAGISDLLQEMKARPRCDNFLLVCFNLTEVEMNDFEKLNLVIQRLRKNYNDRLSPLLKNIKTMQRLQTTASSSNIPAEVYKEIKALEPEVLKKEINTVRGEYFHIVAQKIATEYLLFQNKSLHVAFRKVPGYEADSGEGANIALALRLLRKYNQPNLGWKSVSATTSSRASSTRAGKNVTSQNPTIEPFIDEVVKNINALLFYPKINEEEVVASTKKDAERGVLRSNDPRLFCFVVARHLSLIFATFEELGRDPKIKDAIIDKVIGFKAKEWGYAEYESDNNAIEKIDKIKVGWGEEDTGIVKSIQDLDLGQIKSIKGIKTIIVAALKAAESSSSAFMYEGGSLDNSVLESSPLKESSAVNQSQLGGLVGASAESPVKQSARSSDWSLAASSTLRRKSSVQGQQQSSTPNTGDEELGSKVDSSASTLYQRGKPGTKNNKT